MKMIRINITNNKLQSVTMIPYDERIFPPAFVKAAGRYFDLTKNGVECVVDRYGINDQIVEIIAKTDSFTAALTAAFYVCGQDVIDNL